MDFKVLITDTAIEDLKEIVEFVALDDPQAAARLGEKLISRALSLSDLPERHPFHDEDRGIRKMPVASYIVYYSCHSSPKMVYILHFWHGARQHPEF